MPSNFSVGELAPDFTLPKNNGGTVTLSGFKGGAVILYFYPKDDTSGCTKEAQEFSENLSEFNRLKAHIIGISKDSIARHDKFVEKYNLTIDLASDVDGKVIDAYGVWVEKNMYGRKYMGIERATYLIDASGKIAHIWRKVRVKGHVGKVLEAARALRK